MHGVELEVIWDGSHRNQDADLFSPVEFCEQEPAWRDRVRSSQPVSAWAMDTMANLLTGDWQAQATLAGKAEFSREVARRALRRLVEAGIADGEVTPSPVNGRPQWRYRKKA